MSIDRDENIIFHDEGTLKAVTRWLSTHDEGIAELLKNVRRAYQVDRANVDEQHRVAVLLLKDQHQHNPARIGILDVGGATIEDVERWKIWQDPEASSRGSGLLEEETQGNGGKAYLYSMFEGQARILGVADHTRNCRGFEGPRLSLERGKPGFIPSQAEGREVRMVDWKTDLQAALQPYGLDFGDLPLEVRKALEERQRFTLVEGIEPVGLYYRGKIDAADLVQKVLRHDQSTLAVQQLRIFAIHNGVALFNGRPLELEPIPPYPGLEGPFVYEIPDELLDEDGVSQSTTQGGTKPQGRLILSTSKENMHLRYKVLRPRWKLSYRAGHQMLGSKSISELAPATPGSEFIYGEVQLGALAAYATHGRTRPKDGPLVQAADIFIVEKIRELAKQINELRRHNQDNNELDEVQKENKLLDNFKNKFMPTDGFGGNGDLGREGLGPPDPPPPPPPPIYGEVPSFIEIGWPEDKVLKLGAGISLNTTTVLKPHVRDEDEHIVPTAELEWVSDNESIVRFEGKKIMARRSGICNIYAHVKGTKIYSPQIAVDVWLVDHVLLTPRSLEIPLGKKETIIAEVTRDTGERSTEVLLEWSHDADDQLIVRINPFGHVLGNRKGIDKY